jgi:hypothetical protein
MSFLSGKSAKVVVDDTDMSGYFSSADLGRDAQLLETTTLGATSRTYLTGFKSGTASFRGFYDAAAGAIDAILNAALGSAGGEIVTVAPDGLTVGKRLSMLLSRLTKYSTTTPVDGVVSISAEMQADGGIDPGVSLHDLAEETASGSGAEVDNGAATNNGGVAHLHVTATIATSTETLDVIIEHSATGAWAGEETTLVTFTQLALATTQQRVEVAAGVEVKQYLRSDWTEAGAGTPGWTFTVGFGRR